METWFGKPKLDEACEAWKEFKNIKREESEAVDKFILKYETCESNLKCSVVELSQLILALQLVGSLNVSKDQKRNILANIKIENTDTIYEQRRIRITQIMKKWILQIRKEKNGVNHVQDPKVDKEKVADLSGIQAVKRENTEATDLKKVVVQDTSIEKEAGIYTNKVETDS